MTSHLGEPGCKVSIILPNQEITIMTKNEVRTEVFNSTKTTVKYISG